MEEPEAGGMQKVSVEWTISSDKRLVAALSVNNVPHNRMTYRAEMDANLVRSTRLNLHIQQ